LTEQNMPLGGSRTDGFGAFSRVMVMLISVLLEDVDPLHNGKPLTVQP
jgi:hypothetical protein